MGDPLFGAKFVEGFNNFIEGMFSTENLIGAFSFFIEYVFTFLIAASTIFIVARFLENAIESEKQTQQYDKKTYDVLGVRVTEKKVKKNTNAQIFTKRNVLEERILRDAFSESNRKRLLKIKKTLDETGLPINIIHFLIVSIALSGLMYYGILKFDVIDPALLIPISICIGFYASINIFEAIAEARIKKLRARFPDALDMMNRSLKTGFDTEKSILLISKADLGEISKEFYQIYRRISIGIPAHKAVSEAINKVPIEEFKFFSVALGVHSEAGGNLIELISNLAGVVRRRQELEMKIETLSSEAKMTAKILSSLPIGLSGIFYWMNPKHFDPFLQPGTGKTLLFVAVASYVIGLAIIKKVSKIKA